MSQLVVRNLPPELVARLKRRAAEHGLSAEAEHREILKQALLGKATPSLKAVLTEMPDVGEDSDFARAPSKRRRVHL
jgi:plasmid stability protein